MAPNTHPLLRVLTAGFFIYHGDPPYTCPCYAKILSDLCKFSWRRVECFSRMTNCQQAVELLCDAYLARAGGLMRAMQPHAVLFLGDLMDGALMYSDKDFERSLQRLERVLSPPSSAATIHVAGNHDIGVH